MMCETVRIWSDAKGHEGGVMINAADFDPEVHVLWDDEVAGPSPVSETGAELVTEVEDPVAPRGRKTKK